MSGIKISNLPASTTPLSGSEIVPLVQDGVTKRATVTQIGTVTATGSTAARTLPDRFADVVNVKDFGAVGDGVTNDTAAIQASFVAANGQTVYFPSGVYNLASAYAAPTGSKAFIDNGSFATNTPTNVDFYFTSADPVAIAGSEMKIERLFEDSQYKLKNEAGIWAGKVDTYFGVSKTFSSSDGSANAPSNAFFAYANNDGSFGDIVAVMGVAVARTNNATVFGGNLIARDNAVINPKLVGLEIDLEPAPGTTCSTGSIGLALNVFSGAQPAPAIQLGGLGGGKWANGVIIAAVTGAGIATQSGNTIGSLVNSSAGAYTNAAIVLGGGANTDGLLFKSGLRIYEDVSGNLRATIPSGKVVAFRNSTDTTSVLSVTATGNVAIAGGLTLSGGLGDYADDTAAAAGGVDIGGFYRTASVVKIRVT